MIQPVIVSVKSQEASVKELVAHCYALDGTEVKVVPLTPEDDTKFVPAYPKNDKACRAAFSLHCAAVAMKGQPFIWLEHDSVPLKAGWVKTLSDEYERLGKPFMLSSDSNPPFDLVGGIGVYSGDTSWMVPTQIKEREGIIHIAHGWDAWMVTHMPELISRTPLIQHSYGVYEKGIASKHQFPRDAKMLRKDAVIFHRDSDHTLLTEKNRTPKETIYAHSGDLGDVAYALETIRRLGGGHLKLGTDMGFKFHSHCREPMTPERVKLIKGLAEAQDYILSVSHFEGKPDPSWFNLNLFRSTFRGCKGPTCTNLQRASLRHFGLSVQDETQPWLKVKLSEKRDHRITVARSPRYHNDAFPWKELVEKYDERMFFVGLETEYKDFCQEFGKVGRVETPTLLDCAKAIQRGSIFIGNQSCPYAIAEGLKKPAVLECWTTESNTLFQRPDVLNMTTDFNRISEFIEAHI